MNEVHTAVDPPSPQRIELKRIELRRDLYGQIEVKRGVKPGITSENQLIDDLQADEELAVVEFHERDHDGWYKINQFNEGLLATHPTSFKFEGRGWHLIGGTINGSGRGELLACTNKDILSKVVIGWGKLDGLNRMKCLSRLMQPSLQGSPFALRLVVMDDSIHDGDAILGQSGLEILSESFAQPEATVFKCISNWLKVVFRKSHDHWDELPAGVTRQDKQLMFNGMAIDGILYHDNIKLGKRAYKSEQIYEFTEQDIRLHCTETRTNFHRAGLSRQLLQYLTAEQAAPLLAASDIPLNASNWAKALTGDVEALKYLLHHAADDNADEHEIRNQLLRHLDAGCDDVTIPYLRQRVLPLLAGVFKNRIRKGRCPGAYLYVAPSTKLGKYEISVPTRMLSHEERDSIRAGNTIEVMATRYPITGHASINKLTITGMHRGAVVYVNPDTWLKSFQGDYDGDCITILRVDAEGWQNSEPFIPPTSPPTNPMTMPRALEQAATSKRDVALGESVIADYIHHCWEKYGKLDPEELNELGTRVICAAVDRAKHGQVDWGISPDDFSRDFLPDPDRHQHSVLAAKKISESQRPEDELRERLMRLKAGKFGTERSGWELLLGLLHDWTDGTAIMGYGTHDKLHERICRIHASLPAPCKRTFELVKLARKRWASAVDQWKRTDDDTAMKAFVERFSGWIARTDETLTTKVMLELGKQLLRPKKKGNASLFLSQVPSRLLSQVYTSSKQLH